MSRWSQGSLDTFSCHAVGCVRLRVLRRGRQDICRTLVAFTATCKFFIIIFISISLYSCNCSKIYCLCHSVRLPLKTSASDWPSREPCSHGRITHDRGCGRSKNPGMILLRPCRDAILHSKRGTAAVNHAVSSLNRNSLRVLVRLIILLFLRLNEHGDP